MKKRASQKDTGLLRETLGVSIAWLIASLAAHSILMFIIAANNNVFLAEVPSRMGAGTFLLDGSVALTITGSFAIAMILMTLIVGFYARAGNEMSSAVTAGLQSFFGFSFLALVFGNIVEHSFNSTFLTIIAFLIVVGGLVVSFYYLTRTPAK